jgi:hypothetical protein
MIFNLFKKQVEDEQREILEKSIRITNLKVTVTTYQ